jgi:glycosyltransferase involved in cell wall biosynthesis
MGDLFPPERVHTSFLQKVPGIRKYFRAAAPFYPRAFEAFDLSAYDLVVSSTTAWAKGVRLKPGAIHVCYIHAVARFRFAYDAYVGGLGLATLARPLVRELVRWDEHAAQLPTRYVANARNVARRVREHYGREADVLAPPVDVERFTVGPGDGDYFLVASRLLPYKRVDLAIRAAAAAGVKLVVAGTGPAEASLRALAAGTTTTMLGYVSDAEITRLVGAARAVVVPGEEDFGLVPLEAAASGRPALAYGAGGALETIVDGVTGTFFAEPDAASLAAAFRAFDETRYDAARMRAHAETFAAPQFRQRLRALVDATVAGERTQRRED